MKIRNNLLWERFTDRREGMFEELGGLDPVTERRLFHGSPHTKTIAKNGFKLACAKNGPLGQGENLFE